MWEMDIVEQEEDGVQSVILFGLAVFTGAGDQNSSQVNRTIVARITGSGIEKSYNCHITLKNNILVSVEKCGTLLALLLFGSQARSNHLTGQLADKVNYY